MDNVSGGLPDPGDTYYQGNVPDSFGKSVAIEGTEVKFADEVTEGAQPKRRRSGRFKVARLVRNASAVNLLPARFVKWEAANYGRRVDGYQFGANAQVAGVVDPDLPATGVAPNDLFWCYFEGQVDVEASAAVAIGDVIGSAAVGANEVDPLAGVSAVSTAAEPYAAGIAASAAAAGARSVVDLKLRFR